MLSTWMNMNWKYSEDILSASCRGSFDLQQWFLRGFPTYFFLWSLPNQAGGKGLSSWVVLGCFHRIKSRQEDELSFYFSCVDGIENVFVSSFVGRRIKCAKNASWKPIESGKKASQFGKGLQLKILITFLLQQNLPETGDSKATTVLSPNTAGGENMDNFFLTSHSSPMTTENKPSGDAALRKINEIPTCQCIFMSFTSKLGLFFVACFVLCICV